MVQALRFSMLLACAAVVLAQNPTSTPQPPGMLTPWEIAPVLDEISAHAGRLAAALDRINVKSWIDRGASETYLQQWQSSREQAKALEAGAKVQSRTPEKLSSGLEILFRMQGLDAMTGSLVEGMRKYEKPADAQELARLIGEIGPNRERLERYLVSLAAGQEQQLEVMDKEAQRCRGIMTAPASSSSRTGKKK